MATETCANCGCEFEKVTGYEHVTGTSGGLAWTKWFCSKRCIHEYEAKKKEEFNEKLDKLGGGNRLKGAAIHDLGIIYWAFAAAIWILKKSSLARKRRARSISSLSRTIATGKIRSRV